VRQRIEAERSFTAIEQRRRAQAQGPRASGNDEPESDTAVREARLRALEADLIHEYARDNPRLTTPEELHDAAKAAIAAHRNFGRALRERRANPQDPQTPRTGGWQIPEQTGEYFTQQEAELIGRYTLGQVLGGRTQIARFTDPQGNVRIGGYVVPRSVFNEILQLPNANHGSIEARTGSIIGAIERLAAAGTIRTEAIPVPRIPLGPDGLPDPTAWAANEANLRGALEGDGLDLTFYIGLGTSMTSLIQHAPKTVSEIGDALSGQAREIFSGELAERYRANPEAWARDYPNLSRFSSIARGSHGAVKAP